MLVSIGLGVRVRFGGSKARCSNVATRLLGPFVGQAHGAAPSAGYRLSAGEFSDSLRRGNRMSRASFYLRSSTAIRRRRAHRLSRSVCVSRAPEIVFFRFEGRRRASTSPIRNFVGSGAEPRRVGGPDVVRWSRAAAAYPVWTDGSEDRSPGSRSRGSRRGCGRCPSS